MPATNAKADVTMETVPPPPLPFKAIKVFQMAGPNLEGTLKVTGAKTMSQLAGGKLARIRGHVSLGLEAQAPR